MWDNHLKKYLWLVIFVKEDDSINIFWIKGAATFG